MVRRLVGEGEELVMTHDTRATRTNSLLVAANEAQNIVRPLTRAYWSDDGAAFRLLSWESLVAGARRPRAPSAAP